MAALFFIEFLYIPKHSIPHSLHICRNLVKCFYKELAKFYFKAETTRIVKDYNFLIKFLTVSKYYIANVNQNFDLYNFFECHLVPDRGLLNIKKRGTDALQSKNRLW